ncbi:MAG: ECF-type sigma factor [Planctomycetota bacterium]
MTEVTRIIDQINSGENSPATERLLPLVYEELRRLAAVRMNNERNSHTLSPTALVHEAFVRLTGNSIDVAWNGKGHFLAVASEAMRRILIDHARGRNAQKRGGSAKREPYHESRLFDAETSGELLALDESLARLEADDAEAAKLVKLRFFAGLTNQQAADAIGISPRKANMVWSYARAWLKRDIGT